jgi:TonB family protein
MKRRIAFFLGSALFHFLFFHWFINLSFQVKTYETTEKITEIVLVPGEKIWLPTPERQVQEIVPGTIQPPEGEVPTGSLAGPNAAAAAKKSPLSGRGEKTGPLSIDLDLSLKSNTVAPREFADLEQLQRDIETSKKRNLGRYAYRFDPENPGIGRVHLAAGKGDFFQVRHYNIKPWARQAVDKIQLNWSVPLATAVGVEGRVGIVVVVEKDGRISKTEVRQSSGREALDQAALLAIRASTPLPGLPDDFPAQNIEVYFVFEYGEK